MVESVLTWWAGWIPAFVLTCAIEVPVYLLVLGLAGLTGGEQARITRAQAALTAVGVNVATHPLFWAIALELDDMAGLVMAELAVIVVEGLLLFAVLRQRWWACAGCALVANTASAVLGTAAAGALTSWAA
ncbi:MAG TPA: hypothetical protein VFP34_14545 [Microlunatus sp.]|nr:hypothetical protein [Microlunatus sp.]